MKNRQLPRFYLRQSMVYYSCQSWQEEVDPIRKIHGGQVRYYVSLLFLFLAYLAICMTFFIVYERSAVGGQALRTLRHNVQQQCEHFNSVIDTQFASLEGLADFIAQQGELTDPDNLVMADMIVSNGDFARILLIAPDGTGYSNDGVVTNVSYRNYFLQAVSGTRFVSDPLSSSVDSLQKVVLAVPITTSDGEILGVVGGAYDIGQLSELLFSGLYQGSGYPILTTSTGQFVSAAIPSLPGSHSNFFDYCSSLELLEGAAPAQVRRDFANGTSGYFSARNGSEMQYVVYQSAGLDNGWMMCYTVSGEEAGADYNFIFHDILCLGAAFLIGMLCLIVAFLHLSLRERRQLLRQAQTDPLTGLLNRSSTYECVSAWLADPDCHGAFMMLDLDNFKGINDAYGHQAGDAILSITATLLKTHFRQSDVVGRIGGDEFIILMKGVSSKSVVEKHLHRLCEEFRLLTHPDYPQITLSCSIGAAMVPEQGNSFETLYANADRALYCAKQRGKDDYSIYTGNCV